MIVFDWVNEAATKIDRLDAELILTNLLRVKDRSYLVAHDDEILTKSQLELANAQLERRIGGEPLAYILGWREFYGRRFKVTRNVLIPRPETETIIELAKKSKATKILDVGTGSGCIAITCALEMPKVAVDAIDISTSALAIAQANARALGAKVNFFKSDLLENYELEPDTLIIANLPYVDQDWEWINRQTLSFEPSLALYAEQGGLALIYRLIQSINTSCRLLIEADPSQHEKIIAFARDFGFKKPTKKTSFYLLKNSISMLQLE